MPTEFRVDRSLRLVRSSASGKLTENESLQHYARLRADPSFQPTFRQLCDLRAVTDIEASVPFLQELARTSTFAPGAKRAFVAPTDLYYGLARMLQMFGELEGSEIGVFRTMEEAEAWLELTPREA